MTQDWTDHAETDAGGGDHLRPEDAPKPPDVEVVAQPAAAVSVKPPYPGIGQAIGLLLLLFLLQVVASSPLAMFGLGYHPLAVGCVSLVTFAIIVAWGIRKTRASFSEVIPLRAVRVSLLGAMFVAVVGFSVVISEVTNVLQSFLPPPAWFAQIMENLIGGKQSLWGSILLASIIAPVTEEPMFRGLILRGFLARYTAGKAIVASSLLFALFHMNPWQFAAGAFTGALFAWCFVRTRSLVPCIFGHLVNNSLGWLFMVFHLQVPGYTSALTDGVVHQPLWFTAAGVLLAGAGIMLLKKSFDGGDTWQANRRDLEGFKS
jgi:uncharacterized protein